MFSTVAMNIGPTILVQLRTSVLSIPVRPQTWVVSILVQRHEPRSYLVVLTFGCLSHALTSNYDILVTSFLQSHCNQKIFYKN